MLYIFCGAAEIEWTPEALDDLAEAVAATPDTTPRVSLPLEVLARRHAALSGLLASQPGLGFADALSVSRLLALE